MQIHSATSCVEFIELLRERAIAANAAPAVIDQIDWLLDADVLENQLCEADQKIVDLKEIVADLLNDLETVQTALGEMIEMAMHAAPADCDMNQSNIDEASRELKFIKKQLKKYAEYA